MVKIELVSVWYNERFLAPLFLRHYHWVDRIHLLIDTDTDDGTPEVVRSVSDDLGLDVLIHPFLFPDGLDDGLKVSGINRMVRSLQADWACVVDADEFVWADGFADPREVLATIPDAVVYADMWNVYRHRTDTDIVPDPKMVKGDEVVKQRRHGDPVPNPMMCKPVFARTSAKPVWSVGNHEISFIGKVSPVRFRGAHWANADPCFCIERQVKNRRYHMSRQNVKKRWSFQHFTITDQEIHDICHSHLDDPLLW